MGDLAQMQVAADARLAQAKLEYEVLGRTADYVRGLADLDVTFEVLQLEASQIEISVVIGGIADPCVQGALEAAAEPVDVATVEPECALEPVGLSPAVPPVPVAASPAPEWVTGRYSPKEIERTHALLDQGKTGRQIAKVLGRKPSAVSVFVAGLRKQRGDGKVAGPAAGKPKPEKATAFKRKLIPGKDRVPAPTARAASKPVAVVKSTPPEDQILLSGVAGERPYAEREIIAHLGSIGHKDGWTPARDLELVEEICRGNNLDVIAAELRVGRDACKARWKLLNSRIGDADHQGRLVRILRERATGATG